MRTVTIIFTWTFVIARHNCHICVYLMVNVVFTVVTWTMTFFIKTYLLSPFLIIFCWLWTFCNHVIFISTSKAFTRLTFHLSIGWNTNCTSFLLFLSYPFEAFLCRVIVTPTKCALCLKSMCSFTIPTRIWAAIKV